MYRKLCKNTGMVRQCFFFSAFIIGMVVGWIALDQVTGAWFAGQADGASVSKMFSLVVLKFGLALASGAMAVVPYVFLTIDVAQQLEKQARQAAAANFSSFLTVGIHSAILPAQPAQGSLRRPPRAFS